MPANAINEDLRSRKTERALYAAMFSLLRKNNFRKITIKSICEEALISRAAFYAHFIDKYDLLRHWIAELWPKEFCCKGNYDETEESINCHIRDNVLIYENIICDADSETYDIMFGFLISTINLSVEKNNAGKLSPRNIVLANFYAAGIISYLLWQIKNKLPADVPPMNQYFYEMIHGLESWQSNKDELGGKLG